MNLDILKSLAKSCVRDVQGVQLAGDPVAAKIIEISEADHNENKQVSLSVHVPRADLSVGHNGHVGTCLDSNVTQVTTQVEPSSYMGSRGDGHIGHDGQQKNKNPLSVEENKKLEKLRQLIWQVSQNYGGDTQEHLEQHFQEVIDTYDMQDSIDCYEREYQLSEAYCRSARYK